MDLSSAKLSVQHLHKNASGRQDSEASDADGKPPPFIHLPDLNQGLDRQSSTASLHQRHASEPIGHPIRSVSASWARQRPNPYDPTRRPSHVMEMMNFTTHDSPAYGYDGSPEPSLYLHDGVASPIAPLHIGQGINVDAAIHIYEQAHLEGKKGQEGNLWDVKNKKNTTFVLHPESATRMVFDSVMGIILLYTTLALPFRVSFSVDAVGFWFVLETCFDVMFGTDLCLNFITAVYVDGVLVTSIKKIALNYLKCWFWVDSISVFPFEFVLLQILADDAGGRNASRLPKMMKLLRIIRLVKILRIFRLSRLYLKLTASLTLNSSLWRLLKLFVMIMFVAHFLACAAYLVASYAESEGSAGLTWISLHDIKQQPVEHRYLASFYLAIQTITTVGYGDILGITVSERAYYTLAMIIGTTIFSAQVGMMSYLILRFNSDPAQERIDSVNRYLSFRKVPKDLSIAIREHYLFSYNSRQTMLDERSVLGELSPTLRLRLILYLKTQIFKDTILWEGCSTEFVTAVILRLRPTTAAPADVIIHEGALGDELFIIIRGECQVCNLSGSIVYATLTHGDYFGEIALFSEDGIRTASVKALSHCQLDVLSKADLKELASEYSNGFDPSRVLARAAERMDEIQRTNQAHEGGLQESQHSGLDSEEEMNLKDPNSKRLSLNDFGTALVSKRSSVSLPPGVTLLDDDKKIEGSLHNEILKKLEGLEKRLGTSMLKLPPGGLKQLSMLRHQDNTVVSKKDARRLYEQVAATVEYSSREDTMRVVVSVAGASADPYDLRRLLKNKDAMMDAVEDAEGVVALGGGAQLRSSTGPLWGTSSDLHGSARGRKGRLPNSPLVAAVEAVEGRLRRVDECSVNTEDATGRVSSAESSTWSVAWDEAEEAEAAPGKRHTNGRKES